MAAGHSRLGPSSAGQWVYCPGSVVMQENYPDEGEDGLDGEASHWVGAELLQGRAHNPGEQAPNGVVLDMTMVQGANEYAIEACKYAAGARAIYVEQPLPIPQVHPECWGTPDLWFHLIMGQTCPELHVWDYKYGWGLVEVAHNWQLTCYAAGALAVVQAPPDTLVIFHIAQPRPYHHLGSIRHWRVKAEHLAPAILQLREAAAEALGPNPRCKSGSHCRYCRARHACTAFRNSAYAAIDYVDHARPHELTAEALGVELEILEAAEQRIAHLKAGVEAQAKGLIQSGCPVPGWTIDRGAGKTTWNVPAETLFAVGDLLNVNLRKVEPITPYQAKQAGFPADLAASYSTRGAGTEKLIKSSRSLAAQVFGPAAAERNRNAG